MPAIKKILFPVDFSDSCFCAARYVEALAGQYEAEVILLHVVGMNEHALSDELLPGRRKELDAFLADELKCFNTLRTCVVGEPAEQIVAAARQINPDLIAMPTHGLGVFRRLLLGSVTAKVLNDLECPVWTDAHLETPKPLEEIHCKRILCAVDLSERSQSILEWAAWMAGEYQADIGIVHATPQMSGAYYGYGLEQEFAESMAEEATARIEAMQAIAGTTGKVFIGSGNPAAIVSCAAKQFEADLLVMGRHSKAGIAGYLRPHAYSVLRESPCPAISI